jgi:hypothetical protein
MLVIVPLSVPLDVAVAVVGVSESAQGPLIGRLRGYLDPSRDLLYKEVAGESAWTYSFSTGMHKWAGFIASRPPSGGPPTEESKAGLPCPTTLLRSASLAGSQKATPAHSALRGTLNTGR